MIKTIVTVETIAQTGETGELKAVETTGTISPGDIDVEEDMRVHRESAMSLAAMVERAVQVNLERLADMLEDAQKADTKPEDVEKPEKTEEKA